MTVNTQHVIRHMGTHRGERALGLIVGFHAGRGREACGDAVGAVRCELCGYLVEGRALSEGRVRVRGRASLASAGQCIWRRERGCGKGEGKRWLEAGSHRTSSCGQDCGFYSE